MRRSTAREIIRQRRARNMIMPYIEHIGAVVQVQSHVRGFLARKRFAALKEENDEIDREVASRVIQRNFRLYLFRKRNIHAARIARFIRRLPALRDRRLRKIRDNLRRIAVREALRRWIRGNRYVDLPGFTPPLQRAAGERIRTFIDDRNARREARQHNWDVLDRRLRTIRRDIDSIITPGPATAPAARAVITTPALRPVHPALPPPPVPPVLRGRPRHIAGRDPTPPRPAHRPRPTIRHRLEEIERQFQDPRIRDIYRNNRVILPDGNRVIPAARGGYHLRPDPHPVGRPELPDTPVVSPARARDCPVCLETKADFRMVDPGCGHLVCFRCTQGMITAALGNAMTNIPIRCPMSRDGCDRLVTPYTDRVKPLVASRDYEKFERYHILKLHVPQNRLRYCPNSSCGMPFEIDDVIVDELSSPPRREDFRLHASCPECATGMCIYCNDFAHVGLSCRDFQRRQQTDSDATSAYIRNYCKKCPLCRVNVQKQQLPEQEQHERTTGMAGGTSECHHVTCGACKGDFCWTCLKTYSGATYYHRTCPNNDCTITFAGGVPRITHLPIGQQSYIKMVTYRGESIVRERVYQINNSQAILGASPSAYTTRNKTVVLHCGEDGVVRRLEGLLGDYTFRQNNRA